jgi:hypothetical protein
VDLSGEAPRIEMRPIKKAEEEEVEEKEEVQVENQKPKEYDENGLEIIDEGDDVPPPPVVKKPAARKKSATPVRKAKSKSPSAAVETDIEEENDDDDDDELPTVEEAMQKGKLARKDRAMSTTSVTSQHRPRVGSSTGNATEAERVRVEKKEQDRIRREKEISRRRSVPRNEEEVVEEE